MAAKKRRSTKRKTTTRTATKKTAGKKAAAKKPVVIKAKPNITPVKATFTKSQTYSQISGETGLNRKQVNEVFESLTNVIKRHVRKGAIGEFTLPGLAKLRVVRKPATNARKGVNPFTGEQTIFKAKPARNVVKVRPLKKLKEMAI